MPFDVSQKPQKVTFPGQKSQPTIGPPPEAHDPNKGDPRYEAVRVLKTAASRRAMAARPSRRRKMGVMGTQPTFDPPGGGTSPAVAEVAESPWYKNPWYWAGVLGAVYVWRMRK